MVGAGPYKDCAPDLAGPRARQLALKLGDQFRYRLTQRASSDTSTVFEHAPPVADGVLVHRPAAPTPCTADGREEVGTDAAFDFHVLRIPSSFLVGFDGFAVFGGFALGLRSSSFGRTCPLAIFVSLHSLSRRLPRHIFRCARIETRFQPVEQTGPCAPGLCAALQSGAHVIV